MKKILITGGAGFIGANLCRYLLEKGNRVLCIDNFYSSSKDNIKELFDSPEFEFIEHDINNKLALKVDEIYHLACPASPVFYQKDPIYTLRTCFLGSINLLELAKKNKCKILFTSTSEIYGDPISHPQSENYFGNVNPIGPRSCYDEGKRVTESLFVNYHLKQKVDTRIVRIFNTYGPKMNKNDGRVVSNFIIAALKDEALILHGEGNQTRSFCYIDDMLEGLYKAMNSIEYIGPINLGNPEEITIEKLAKLIANSVKTNSLFISKSSRFDDPLRRKPNIDRAKRFLDWYPEVSLKEGLIKTINYFKRRYFQ